MRIVGAVELEVASSPAVTTTFQCLLMWRVLECSWTEHLYHARLGRLPQLILTSVMASARRRRQLQDDNALWAAPDCTHTHSKNLAFAWSRSTGLHQFIRCNCNRLQLHGLHVVASATRTRPMHVGMCYSAYLPVMIKWRAGSEIYTVCSAERTAPAKNPALTQRHLENGASRTLPHGLLSTTKIQGGMVYQSPFLIFWLRRGEKAWA